MDPKGRSFQERARSLFALRLPFLLGAGAILASPRWSLALGLTAPSLGWAWVAGLLAASAQALALPRLSPPWQRRATLAGLGLDLAVLSVWILGTGGLRSPLIPAQLLLTGLIALLFPRPAAALPGVASLAVAAWLGPKTAGGQLFDLALLLVMGSLHLATAYLLTHFDRRERRLRQERDALWRELGAANERARVARELHDGVGGTVAALVMQAQVLDALPLPSSAKHQGARLLDTAREALEELRRSLHVLRGDFDLFEAIRSHCIHFEGRSGIPVALRLEGGPPPLGPEARLSLFRVVQEGLTNVLRHARATRVELRIASAPGSTSLELRDDGVGLAAPPPGRGYGLRGFQERALLLGGSVSVEGEPGRGTTVHFVVPHDEEAA